MFDSLGTGAESIPVVLHAKHHCYLETIPVNSQAPPAETLRAEPKNLSYQIFQVILTHKFETHWSKLMNESEKKQNKTQNSLSVQLLFKVISLI